MNAARRELLKYAAMAGAAALGQGHSKASTSEPRMPGPFPGLVAGVEHPGSIVGSAFMDPNVDLCQTAAFGYWLFWRRGCMGSTVAARPRQTRVVK